MTKLQTPKIVSREEWEDSPKAWPQDEAGSWWNQNGRPVAQWTRTAEMVT